MSSDNINRIEKVEYLEVIPEEWDDWQTIQVNLTFTDSNVMQSTWDEFRYCEWEFTKEMNYLNDHRCATINKLVRRMLDLKYEEGVESATAEIEKD